MANLSLNIDLSVNDESAFAALVATANTTSNHEVQAGFVIPKSLFRDSIVETLFTFEGDKFGFYLNVLGLFVNYTNLGRIAKDEITQRRLVA